MLKPTGIQIGIAGLAALAVAMGIGRFAFTPLLPMMQEDFGLSVAEGGWLASANYAGYLIGALSVMVLPVRPDIAIRCGLLAIGLTTLAMGIADRFGVWIVLRALAGIASALVLIHVSAWALERLAPLRRPLLNGVVFAGVGAGITMVGVLCIALMHAAVGSAQTWIALGILSLVLTVAMWRAFATGGYVPTMPGAQQSKRPPGWYREAARLVFSYAAFGFGYIIPATFLPAMARQAIQDPAVFGWSWPIFGAAAALSTLAAAWLSASIGNRPLWIVSLLVMACGVALPVVLPGIAAILLSALLVGGTFMVATMNGLKEAREMGGDNLTGLTAAMTAAFAFGQIAGPVSVSYLAGSGYTGPLLIACASLAVGACVLLRRARAAPAPQPVRS